MKDTNPYMRLQTCISFGWNMYCFMILSIFTAYQLENLFENVYFDFLLKRTPKISKAISSFCWNMYCLMILSIFAVYQLENLFENVYFDFLLKGTPEISKAIIVSPASLVKVCLFLYARRHLE